MPVYGYQCPVCGVKFERNLRFSEENHRVNCPNGHPNALKLFSAPAIVFKGSGFYKTDHPAKHDSKA